MLIIIQEMKKVYFINKYLLYYKNECIILNVLDVKLRCPNKYIVTIFILLFNIFKSMFNEEIF